MAVNKFNGQVQELRIGKTFSKGHRGESYHTIRYDFKPASVDTQKVGTMEVDDKEVTLSVPYIEGIGSSQAAIFKGNKIPASRDCVLIIDQTTGEIVLERVSHNIRVKKTRLEKNSKKLPPNLDSGSRKPSPSQNSLPVPTNPSRAKQRSPNIKNNSPSSGKASSSLTANSMPMLSLMDENKNAGAMSDSSSDSDSGSSSSSDSDSESEQETAARPHNNYQANGNHYPQNGFATSSLLSDDLNLSEED